MSNQAKCKLVELDLESLLVVKVREGLGKESLLLHYPGALLMQAMLYQTQKIGC